VSTINENTVVKIKFPWSEEYNSIIGNKLTKNEADLLVGIIEAFLTAADPSKKLKMGKRRKSQNS